VKGDNFQDLGGDLSVTASVKVDSFQLEAIYTATGHYGNFIAQETVGASQSKTTVNGIVDFSGFTADVFKVFNTPIGTTAKKSVDKGFEQLTTALDTLEKNNSLKWTAYVSSVSDQPGAIVVKIRAGSETGLCAGDRLAIHNMAYRWEGQTCQSKLLDGIPIRPEPNAVVEVFNVGERISYAKVDSPPSDFPIQIGARVTVSKLADVDDKCNPIQRQATTKKK